MENPNQQYIDKLTEKDKDILDSINLLLNECKYDDALKKVEERLKQPFDYEEKVSQFCRSELVLCLIDIGAEGRLPDVIKVGVEQLEDLHKSMSLMSEGSYHYNMGNAKQGLFEIKTLTDENDNFQIPKAINLIIEAKNHHLQAFQSFVNEGIAPPLELYNNIANTFNSLGRIIEAIHLFDYILSQVPTFPQANYNRARCLEFLKLHTFHSTWEQIYEIYEGYKKASGENIPSDKFEYAVLQSDYYSNILEENDESWEHEKYLSAEEAKNHSPYRLFCIEKKLALNEHSIYCKGASEDDIVISSVNVKKYLIAECELVLNRLKSEFGLARWMFFQSISENDSISSTIDKEITFVELYENESIGAKSEMLRTSFRLCFGILDKIAKAICTYFNLPKNSNENIYFDSFWKNHNAEKNGRWVAIKSIENPFITALYSLASDLNKYGKLSDYKKWRNNLEHNLLILTQNDETNSKITSPYIENEELFQVVEVKEFREKTEHLLHLTASAIFNYVFCIRYEAAKDVEQDSDKYFTLHEKLS